MNYIAVGLENSTDIKLCPQDPGNEQPVIFSHDRTLKLTTSANPVGLPIVLAPGSISIASPITRSSHSQAAQKFRC